MLLAENDRWCGGLIVGSVVFLPCFSIWVAVMMSQKISNTGGPGEDESSAFKEVKQRMEDSR